ncbi:hypothetical protein DFH06DRAFT_1143424 [Mycena polygramma]|nr:hypothetical protein DFH06DRAFT_1143424 [Mycena polygramma]
MEFLFIAQAPAPELGNVQKIVRLGPPKTRSVAIETGDEWCIAVQPETTHCYTTPRQDTEWQEIRAEVEYRELARREGRATMAQVLCTAPQTLGHAPPHITHRRSRTTSALHRSPFRHHVSTARAARATIKEPARVRRRPSPDAVHHTLAIYRRQWAPAYMLHRRGACVPRPHPPQRHARRTNHCTSARHGKAVSYMPHRRTSHDPYPPRLGKGKGACSIADIAVDSPPPPCPPRRERSVQHVTSASARHFYTQHRHAVRLGLPSALPHPGAPACEARVSAPPHESARKVGASYAPSLRVENVVREWRLERESERKRTEDRRGGGGSEKKGEGDGPHARSSLSSLPVPKRNRRLDPGHYTADPHDAVGTREHGAREHGARGAAAAHKHEAPWLRRSGTDEIRAGWGGQSFSVCLRGVRHARRRGLE